MKKLVLDFKGFVNENFDSENEPFGAGQETVSAAELPKEVGAIATAIIRGNFEEFKILGIEGETIKLRASKQDFKYAPDVLTLRDLGFETWSSKPYDVQLELDDADPATSELTYFIVFSPKEMRRAKVENTDADFEIEDEYEKPSEFEDLPETPEEDQDDVVSKTGNLFRAEDELEDSEEEDDGLYEGRKKAQAGGFPKLKIKQAPKKDNPNLNIPKPKGKGFKPETKSDLMKKDPNKMVDVAKEKKEPPIKK